jgi:KaiC/GvpD/RAD55 family RecA-like ATPase
MENTYIPTGVAMLDKLLKNGMPAGKLTMLVGQKQEPTISFLRRCLCTQIISQGDCRLGEIVRQVRMDNL